MNLSDDDSVALMKEYNSGLVENIVNAQAKDGTIDGEKMLKKISQFFPLVASDLNDDNVSDMSESEAAKYISKIVDEVFEKKSAELDQKAIESGKSGNSIGRLARYIMLVTLDNAWSEHLQTLENLKDIIQFRQYQGKDPFKESTKEAFGYFDVLDVAMRNNAVFSLWQSLN